MLCVCGCLFVTDKRQNICRTTCHVTDPKLDAQNHKNLSPTFFVIVLYRTKRKCSQKLKIKSLVMYTTFAI